MENPALSAFSMPLSNAGLTLWSSAIPLSKIPSLCSSAKSCVASFFAIVTYPWTVHRSPSSAYVLTPWVIFLMAVLGLNQNAPLLADRFIFPVTSLVGLGPKVSPKICLIRLSVSVSVLVGRKFTRSIKSLIYAYWVASMPCSVLAFIFWSMGSIFNDLSALRKNASRADHVSSLYPSTPCLFVRNGL